MTTITSWTEYASFDCSTVVKRSHREQSVKLPLDNFHAIEQHIHSRSGPTDLSPMAFLRPEACDGPDIFTSSTQRKQTYFLDFKRSINQADAEFQSRNHPAQWWIIGSHAAINRAESGPFVCQRIFQNSYRSLTIGPCIYARVNRGNAVRRKLHTETQC